ncbi:MAG: DUF6691 family protein [Pseudomonadota bacterium]
MKGNKREMAAFAAGLIFGIGLCLGQMTNPAKVLAFLDVLGVWDPTLALVFIGAVLTTVVGYRLTMARGTPYLTDRFSLPGTKGVDLPLIAGAVTFGVGWGIAGFCPGPAITALGALSSEALVFLGAMILGLAIGRAIQSTNWRRAPSRPTRHVST